MLTKLTLRLEEQLIEQAKAYAKKNKKNPYLKWLRIIFHY